MPPSPGFTPLSPSCSCLLVTCSTRSLPAVVLFSPGLADFTCTLDPLPKLQTHRANYICRGRPQATQSQISGTELSTTSPKHTGYWNSHLSERYHHPLFLNQNLGQPSSFTPSFLSFPHPVSYQLWHHLLNTLYTKYGYFPHRKLSFFPLKKEFKAFTNSLYNGIFSQLVLNQKPLFGENTLPWNDLSQVRFGRL